MDIVSILEQMAVLFLVTAVGYAANKLKVLTADSNRLLTKLVINVAMPCTVLSSVMNGKVSVTGAQAIGFLGVTIVVFLIGFLISLPSSKLLRVPGEDRGMYRFMMSFGNVGFMGYPIAQAVFGDSATFYVALFNIPISLLSFSVGIFMVSGGEGKIDPKRLINLPFIAGIAAFVIFITGFKTPLIVADTCSLLGQLTTPSAMLVIGSTLASIPLSEAFSEWRIYVLCAIKLIVIPIITWLILRLFISDALMLGVATVLAAAPIATNATMLSMEYGGNERLGSKGVFLSTLFSVATIPLIVYLLLM